MMVSGVSGESVGAVLWGLARRPYVEGPKQVGRSRKDVDEEEMQRGWVKVVVVIILI